MERVFTDGSDLICSLLLFNLLCRRYCSFQQLIVSISFQLFTFNEHGPIQSNPLFPHRFFLLPVVESLHFLTVVSLCYFFYYHYLIFVVHQLFYLCLITLGTQFSVCSLIFMNVLFWFSMLAFLQVLKTVCIAFYKSNYLKHTFLSTL